MQRITRYITFELLKVFIVALTALTTLVLFAVLAQEAIREGLGPTPILRMMPYVLPIALRFAVPATILFATCSIYGRVSADNEIVAIKSLGVSPLVTVWPGLALAFLLSVITVGINDVAASWGKLGVNRVVLQSVEQIAYGMLRTSRSYRDQRFSITVRAVEGRRLIQPTLVFHYNAENGPMTLTADEAELRYDREKNELTFVMINGEVEASTLTAKLGNESVTIPTPLADLAGGPADFALREIPAKIAAKRIEIESREQQLAADVAFSLSLGEFESVGDESWQFRRMALDGEMVALHRLETEPWRRWANGFSCFFFVLVGAPLAIRLRTADFWTTFAACFLPILVVYYPLLMYGTERAKHGQLPPYSVWLGNVVLCGIGCWLLAVVRRR